MGLFMAMNSDDVKKAAENYLAQARKIEEEYKRNMWEIMKIDAEMKKQLKGNEDELKKKRDVFSKKNSELEKRFLECYELAAKNGNVKALFILSSSYAGDNLGMFIPLDKLVTQDLVKSFNGYQKVVSYYEANEPKKGESDFVSHNTMRTAALRHLAEYYEQGKGTSINLLKARENYERLSNVGGNDRELLNFKNRHQTIDTANDYSGNKLKK